MRVGARPILTVSDYFARELPELSVPWQAEDVPDPRLLVLNDNLAHELGLDDRALRSPEGVRMLVGELVLENHALDALERLMRRHPPLALDDQQQAGAARL